MKLILTLLITLSTISLADSNKYNVLFIAIDDLNDWVGYLGGHPQSRTPHIDQLAKEGTAFMNAYCAAPACGPSRTALMYGIFPHKSGSYGHHAIYAPKNLLSKDRLPLNMVFKNNGYYTAGCGKIFHYREKRGWDNYASDKRTSAKLKVITPVKKSNLKYGIYQTDNDSETPDGQLADWAIAQLKQKHNKPFFIALGLKKPHLSWDAPKKYFDQFDKLNIKLPKVPENDLDDIPEAGKIFARQLVGFKTTNDHKQVTAAKGAWQELVYAYLASSSYADANVGRVLNALKESPHADNTIVVLWGDHGWHLGEKMHWRKMSLWERGTRTPFIIKLPGIKASKVEAPVSLQDIFPTLVDLCNLDLKQSLDGYSLKPLITSPNKAWDKAVLMSHGPGNFAIRLREWRLIRYADGSEELYNLEQDPREYINLAQDKNYESQSHTLRQYIPDTWKYVIGPRFKSFLSLFKNPKEKSLK